LPSEEYIEKLAARIWARMGGSDRVRSRRALPRGRGRDTDGLSFIESAWRPHKNKTSDANTFDYPSEEAALDSAQSPAFRRTPLMPSTLEDVQAPMAADARGESLSLENGTVTALNPNASRDDIREQSLAALAPKPFLVGAPEPIPETTILRRYRAITETEWIEAHARQRWRDLVPRWDDVWTGRVAGPSVRARLRKLYRTTIQDDDLFERVERRVEELIEETRQRDGSAFADSQTSLRIPERARHPSERAS
jgi:hypothetical protein